MNIIEAIKDPNLFRPFIGDDIKSWKRWIRALRCIYGLRPKLGEAGQPVHLCTGRDPDLLPASGFNTALFLTGRRSGKSRIAAVIGAYEAALAGREAKLSKGEQGIVAVCAPTKRQGQIVKGYLRSIFETPLLHAEVAEETRDGFQLRNGNRIEILAGDWRTVRGFTLLAAIIDEAAFFGYDAESKVKSDTELIRAIQPSLATSGGKLICISSPYARRGWCFEQYERNFGNDAGRTLVWNAPSRYMNPTLPQSVVDDALAEDLQAAKSEYLGEFRDDIAEFLPRAVIEQLVVKDRLELLPQSNVRYWAFVDVSGGRRDDAALAIAHRSGRVVVIDLLRRYRPPFSPQEVIGQMAREIKRYDLRRVTGDNYAAEFVARAFEANGLRYQKAEKAKSELYSELLPRLCSKEVELLDDKALIDQLASLERRTRSGGRDIIDHPPGGYDDLANAVAGVADVAAAKVIRVGAL